MPPSPDLATYAEQHRWLFDQFAAELGKLGPSLAGAPVELEEANTPLGIAHHAVSVTRAYALGIGCGLDVRRERDLEFRAVGVTVDSLVDLMVATETAMRAAFSALKPASLDIPLPAPEELAGPGTSPFMTPRRAIVESIRHGGVHLGELRLTRSLLLKG